MSCFNSMQVGTCFNAARQEEVEEEKQPQYDQNHTIMQDNTGLRTKILSFFKRTPISGVVKSVVSRSRSLISRFSSHSPNEDDHNPSNSVETVRKSYIPATETVTFPECMSLSLSAAPESVSFSPHAPQTCSTSQFNKIPAVIDEVPSRLVTDDCVAFDFRAKERKGRETTFPEIKKGVVSAGVKWLEPHFSGKKGDENNSTLNTKGMVLANSENVAFEKPPALDDRGQEDWDMSMEESLFGLESDNTCGFDDSPRLYKHRLPEKEPGPWVEPGTVVRTAMWLKPILTGGERLTSVPKNEQHPTSPIRVAEGRFSN